jgi:hypothetical protein
LRLSRAGMGMFQPMTLSPVCLAPFRISMDVCARADGHGPVGTCSRLTALLCFCSPIEGEFARRALVVRVFSLSILCVHGKYMCAL